MSHALREDRGQDFNSEFMMGSDIHRNPYHIAVMRSQLTRNVGILYIELRDEIITAFDEILDLKDDGNMFRVIKDNKFKLILGDRVEECSSIDDCSTDRMQGQ